MPLQLLAYDVEDGYQSVVKNKLLANGFGDRLELIAGGSAGLPDTTVVVEADGPRDAVVKFKVLALTAAGGRDVVLRVAATECAGAWVEDEQTKR